MIRSNAGGFAERVVRAAGEIEHGSKAGVTAAAALYTARIRAEISADTHGTSRLSGVGRYGAAVGAGYRVRVTDRPSALVGARGPLHLLENDTKPHSMAATRGTRGRANKRKNARSTVNPGHPGTHGKHPFLHGVEKASPAASALLGRSIIDSVVRVFG